MNFIQLYCELIIEPIEEERSRLLAKVYSKNIFDILNRKYYRKRLEECEIFLFQKYEFLGSFVNQLH